ncbi:NADH-ubiquinone reductase complex 1 MLRQ subunit [Nitzschia inconspicua]|uniref:NADH-ubiquinone reductase complex 1 MLRQ subunit n=1 Tax=Nitzschia inconspicua TaxID=303405 RepID=A0A9K3LDW7_9STRA|nr:NADH-ubiquinone reductase complex 1 MLRQ subunit [Nitzschia inconspicua]
MFFLARNNATLIGRRASQQLRSKATLHPQELIKQKNDFKKSWLSDPSCYPIMLIMGCGMTWMVGMGANALFGYKDVQVNPNNRGAVLKDWSKEHRTTVMERFAKMKGGVAPEGLGIDHDKFVKEKEQYMQK